jgi:hypothetical protein
VPGFPAGAAEPLRPLSLMVLLFVTVTGIDSNMGLPLRATALYWAGCTMPIRLAPPSPAGPPLGYRGSGNAEFACDLGGGKILIRVLGTEKSLILHWALEINCDSVNDLPFAN